MRLELVVETWHAGGSGRLFHMLGSGVEHSLVLTALGRVCGLGVSLLGNARVYCPLGP